MIFFLIAFTWQLTGQQVNTNPKFKYYEADTVIPASTTIYSNAVPMLTFGWQSLFTRGHIYTAPQTVHFEYALAPFDSTKYWNNATWSNINTISDSNGVFTQLYPVLSPYIKFRATAGANPSTVTLKLLYYIWEL